MVALAQSVERLTGNPTTPVESYGIRSSIRTDIWAFCPPQQRWPTGGEEGYRPSLHMPNPYEESGLYFLITRSSEDEYGLLYFDVGLLS